MNNIEVFRNEQFGELRTVKNDGMVWLVGKDAAEKLGYANTRDALSRHVDEDDKAEVVIHDGSQNRKMTVINESGLYSLVLSSKLPGAKAFKKWVTSAVLPSIRKHGLYATADTVENILSNPDFAIQLLHKYKEEMKQKEALKKKVVEDKPKVTGKGQIYFINKFQM